MGCNTVRCITSLANEGSVALHARMGFTVSVEVDYVVEVKTRL